MKNGEHEDDGSDQIERLELDATGQDLQQRFALQGGIGGERARKEVGHASTLHACDVLAPRACWVQTSGAAPGEPLNDGKRPATPKRFPSGHRQCRGTSAMAV